MGQHLADGEEVLFTEIHIRPFSAQWLLSVRRHAPAAWRAARRTKNGRAGPPDGARPKVDHCGAATFPDRARSMPRAVEACAQLSPRSACGPNWFDNPPAAAITPDVGVVPGFVSTEMELERWPSGRACPAAVPTARGEPAACAPLSRDDAIARRWPRSGHLPSINFA